MEAKVTWQGGMKFVGVGPSSHAVAMDAGREAGGEDSGPRPTELLLCALGGCTGMDVVSILGKMRTPPRSLEIVIAAEQAPEHPKAFRTAKLLVRAEGVPEGNLRKAAQLSYERYCPVGSSLSTEITIEVEARP
ncbi:MAG TPA: OsmC family peroxiredoxin [Candidatus Acetothermia bacterium]|nr:OsmC family peroxiredoxin [Candidatus Acetothermia bacterium]